MHQHMSATADADRPVAPKSAPVSRGGAHHGAWKRVLAVDHCDGERVDGPRPARLSERRDLVSVHVGVCGCAMRRAAGEQCLTGWREGA